MCHIKQYTTSCNNNIRLQILCAHICVCMCLCECVYVCVQYAFKCFEALQRAETVQL